MNDKATPKLHHYKFAYELADGRTGTIDVKNASLIAWDMTRGARKWPDQQGAPNLWQTFVVWHALTRIDEYAGKFEEFKDRDCDAIDMLNSEGESITATAMARALAQTEEDGEPHAPDVNPEDAMVPVDPTRPVAAPS
jgi:hypothetical protein